MLNVTSLFAVNQTHTKTMDTAELRENFLVQDLFADGQINLTYTHYDRMIVGGAAPNGGALTLDTIKETGTPHFLDRREMGVLNIGEPGTIRAGGNSYDIGRGEVLYLGKGAGPVTFEGSGRYYIVSTPAHQALPNKLVTFEDAVQLKLGGPETSNDRTIYQFIHPDVMESCQLVMGYTMLHSGSVWNSLPSHVHERRMEAYLYFDIAPENRVFHFMGEPQETRHLVVGNEQVAVSPPWSIHCGAGTGAYSFCWAMAGDNQTFTDFEPVAIGEML